MAVPWTTSNAAYLLRRAGFGPTAAEVEECVALGQQDAVSRLVDFESIDNSALETRLTQLNLDLDDIFNLYYWWVYRMLYTARPLEEKLTLFWHGHFATSFAKVNDTGFMYSQNQLLRQRGIGDFRTLLVEISRDPAMLFWLDNAFSVKEAPNENYAREVMELFSLGIGNYTQEDIREVARCFTGWSYRGTAFAFIAGIHDTDAKTVLGHSIPAGRGIEDGLDVCTILADSPACAPFIARKLWRFFAAGEPPVAVRDRMVAAYAANSHSIREMLRELFLSDEFYAPTATDEQIKSPLEMYVGTLRSLEASRDIVEYRDFRFFIYNTFIMGQTLFFPPNVKGWDGGRKWINTSTLIARYNFTNSVATIRGPGYQLVDVATLLARANATTAEQVVDALASLLGPLDVGTAARRRLVDYLRTQRDGSLGEFVLTTESIDSKVRGLLALLLSTAEYQANLKGPDAGVVRPVIVAPLLKNGKLVLGASGSNIQPGATVRVTGDEISGTEVFVLSAKKPTKWIVGKKVISTPGGVTLGALLPVGRSATLVVQNPDRGQSDPVDISH